MFRIFIKSILIFIFSTFVSTLANAEEVDGGILDVVASREQKFLIKPVIDTADYLYYTDYTDYTDYTEDDKNTDDISNKEVQKKDFSRFEKQSNINILQTNVAEQLQGAKNGNSGNAVSLISGKVFNQLDSLIEPEINGVQSGIQRSLSSLLNSEGEESSFQNTLSKNISSNFGSIGSNAVKDLYKSASKSLGGNNNEQQSLEGFQKNLAKLMAIGSVKSLVDSAIEESKASSIYGLKNLELEYNYGLEKDQSVRLSLFQPLSQSKDKNDVVFTQLSFAYGTNELDSPNDDRKRATINLGLGYRYITGEIPELNNTPIMLGVNSFIDYQAPYNHLRGSIGAEIKTANLGLTANRYIPIGNYKKVNADSDALYIDYQERVLGGYDVELSGYVPQTNIELFAKRSVWQQYENAEDIFADKLSAKYSPNKMFSVEVGYVKEKRGQGFDSDGMECSVGINYTFDEPLDDQLKFTKIINLTEKQVSDRLFEKVRRENNIRVQNACYASGELFTPAPDVTVGTGPSDIAIGDFNKDGNLDLAVTNAVSNTVSILLGNGSGAFIAGDTLVVGAGNAYSLVSGDFNNDNNLDLAITTGSSNNFISIFLGNGTGNFPISSNIVVGNGLLNMNAGDLNKDGNLDLVVVNYLTAGLGRVYVLFGNGTGGFAGSSLVTGDNAHSVIIEDFNNDNNLDLAVTNESSAMLHLFLGDGAGNFPNNKYISLGVESPASLKSDDFNKDGNKDIIISHFTSDKFSVLLGDGTGNFSIKSKKIGFGGFSSLAIADFNGDGNKDVVFSAWYPSAFVNQEISVNLGDGKGDFCKSKNIKMPTGLLYIENADFNKDGKQDLAIAGNNGGIGNKVYVLLGK
ncbi:MAG: inverse autotransporter beta domain-containing protein [Alphaproteobacteria bacterium]|jgi:hypothetical protein